MTYDWIRDLAERRGHGYALKQSIGVPPGIWKKGDVMIENQMSYSDGFVAGWEAAQEYLRRICLDYEKRTKGDGVGYLATVFYGLFTNQGNFQDLEDAFPKVCRWIQKNSNRNG